MADVATFLTRRCAWCRRAWTEAGWLPGIGEDPQRETATICPHCVARLQERGASR
jgi:hypothetical protein